MRDDPRGEMDKARAKVPPEEVPEADEIDKIAAVSIDPTLAVNAALIPTEGE